MTTELDNSTLEWAAEWIEGSLKGEDNERVREYGRNMAMTLRAAKTGSRVSVGGVVATMRRALGDIAKQRLTSEIEPIDGEISGDFEGAYDIMINVARNALVAPVSVAEDPHPGYDCRGTCVIHSGRFATASPAAPKEEARAKCANCGESIIREGNEWDHEFPYRPECLDATPITTPAPEVVARAAAIEISRAIIDGLPPDDKGAIAAIVRRHCFPRDDEDEG